ncbi:MAG: hypothetical protein WCI55_16130 [Armatimonadota bacterium]
MLTKVRFKGFEAIKATPSLKSIPGMSVGPPSQQASMIPQNSHLMCDLSGRVGIPHLGHR